MQSNVQMTPAIADIGAAIVQAVLAVLDDPKAAASAAKGVADARMLTEDEVKKRLDAAYDVHTANVEALLASERILHEDQKKHDEDVKQLKMQKDALANEWKELLNDQEYNKKWEKDLTRREQALTGFAAGLAGKSAVG